jgi:hypothetical protein
LSTQYSRALSFCLHFLISILSDSLSHLSSSYQSLKKADPQKLDSDRTYTTFDWLEWDYFTLSSGTCTTGDSTVENIVTIRRRHSQTQTAGVVFLKSFRSELTEELLPTEELLLEEAVADEMVLDETVLEDALLE